GCGAMQISIRPEAPAPGRDVSNSSFAGEVLVNWRVKSEDASGVVIQGTGLQEAGIVSGTRDHPSDPISGRASTGMAAIVGVPKGRHTWTVSAFWSIGTARVTGPATTVTIDVP